MGVEDDIAASLPTPPLPAPARRAATIERALRRFDGLDDGEQMTPAGSRAARRRPFRILTNPYAGAFVSLVLVAMVGAPVLWDSMRDPILTSGDRKSAEQPAPVAGRMGAPLASSAATDAAPHEVPAQTEAALEPPPAPAPSAVSEVAVPSPSLATVAESPLASQTEAAADEHIVVTGIRQPLQRSVDMKRQSTTYVDAITAEPAPEADASAGEQLAANGARRPGSPMAAKAMRAETADSAVAANAYGASSRGAWNACTIDDPNRNVAACGSRNAATKGLSDQARDHLADGLARAWRGDLGEAIAAFDRAIAAAPRSSAAYLNRGLAHRRAGDLDRALADLDRAVRYAPRDARTYFNRSLILRQQGDDARAAADERKAVVLDPSYSAVVR